MRRFPASSPSATSRGRPGRGDHRNVRPRGAVRPRPLGSCAQEPGCERQSRVAPHSRVDAANPESCPALAPRRPRNAGLGPRLDGAILGGLSAKEPQRAVRKRLPMRSHFIGRANFDDRPVNSGPQERSSGPLLLLPDSSAGLRVRRPRRGRGQRSRRERRARSRALVSPARASVSASSAVHWGERDRERLTDRPLRAGRVGERLTGRRCESADALSVIALGVPAATQLAFFPSGVRHSGGV